MQVYFGGKKFNRAAVLAAPIKQEYGWRRRKHRRPCEDCGGRTMVHPIGAVACPDCTLIIFGEAGSRTSLNTKLEAAILGGLTTKDGERIAARQ